MNLHYRKSQRKKNRHHKSRRSFLPETLVFSTELKSIGNDRSYTWKLLTEHKEEIAFLLHNHWLFSGLDQQAKSHWRPSLAPEGFCPLSKKVLQREDSQNSKSRNQKTSFKDLTCRCLISDTYSVQYQDKKYYVGIFPNWLPITKLNTRLSFPSVPIAPSLLCAGSASRRMEACVLPWMLHSTPPAACI